MSFQIVLNPVNNTQKSPRSKQNGSSPNKQFKKLKLQLADRCFQIKKKEQDFAEEKAHLLQSHLQEKNSLQSKIKQLESRIHYENENWVSKIDQLRNEKKQQLAQLNDQWKADFNQKVDDKIKWILKNKLYAFIENLRKQIRNLKQNVWQLKKSQKKAIDDTKTSFQNYVTDFTKLSLSNMTQLRQKMNKQEQIRFSAVWHIKKNTEMQFEKIKQKLQNKRIQSQKTQENYKNIIKALKQQNDKYLERINQSQFEAKKLKKEADRLTQQLATKIDLTADEYEKKLLQLEENWRSSTQTLNQKWKGQIKKIKIAADKVKNAFLEKQKLWEERARNVLEVFEKRQARQEDVKLIQNLEIQLIRKQFQLEREKQQVKNAKLELDNMDQIYKRVFYSINTPHNYGTNRERSVKNATSFHLKKVRLPGLGNRSTHPVKSIDKISDFI